MITPAYPSNTILPVARNASTVGLLPSSYFFMSVSSSLSASVVREAFGGGSAQTKLADTASAFVADDATGCAAKGAALGLTASAVAASTFGAGVGTCMPSNIFMPLYSVPDLDWTHLSRTST